MAGQRSTGISTSTLVYSGECYVHEIYVKAGDDNAEVGLANAITTGQTTKLYARALATNQGSRSFPGIGVYFSTGIYATTTGTSPRIEIVYSV